MSRPWVSAAMLLFAVAGCDALVGGECADGYEPVQGRCEPLTGDAVADGGAGGAGSGGHFGAVGRGGYGGGVVCEGEETACWGVCVDLQTSVTNCGACGHVCPTGICVDGACVGDAAGHVVVMGMSFVDSTAASRRALGNAAFLPLGNPVRILDYRRHALDESVDAVRGILHEQGAIRNRLHHLTVAEKDEMVAEVSVHEYGLLLIHDQAFAPDGWGRGFTDLTVNAIGNFARAGGTVIVLSTSASPAMLPLINGLGVVTLDAMAPLTSTQIETDTPNDVITIGVPTPFLAKATTSVFITSDTPNELLSFAFVDADSMSLPVVIHRAFLLD